MKGNYLCSRFKELSTEAMYIQGDQNRKFVILSIDGGGLRGIIPVKILQEIQKRTGISAVTMFDLVAGTSTGGLIACALTASKDGVNPAFTLTDIENIYTQKGKIIFPSKSFISEEISKLTSLTKPKFNATGLSSVLTDLLGDLRISSCLKPIFVPTYDLMSNQAVLFKRRQVITGDAEDAKLYDVCRATSAAPTYLPAYEFNYMDKALVCIDGGIYMNNPSVGAFVEVSKYHEHYNVNPTLDNIFILSLGTGHYSENLGKKRVEQWGELNWATQISDVMMQGVNQTTCYETEELLNDGNYLRLDIEIDDEAHDDMADSSDDTRNYLEGLVAKLLADPATSSKLDDFINKAGLKVTKGPVVIVS